MSVRDRISDIITEELFERFGSSSAAVIGVQLADRILAIPEIAEALSIEIPDEWPGDSDYARGWNDCRRHAKAIIVRASNGLGHSISTGTRSAD